MEKLKDLGKEKFRLTFEKDLSEQDQLWKKIKGIRMEKALVAQSNLLASSSTDYFFFLQNDFIFIRVRCLTKLAIKNAVKSY